MHPEDEAPQAEPNQGAPVAAGARARHRGATRRPITIANLSADLSLEHRIVQAHGKRFSIKLESCFWRGLHDASADRQVRLNHLVAAVAAQTAPSMNLASRLRVFCLANLRSRLTSATYAASRTSL